MTEYTKINGIRVNVEKYHRKLRQLERQDGRRGFIKAPPGPPSAPRVIHSATLTLIPPTGRQVYPTLEWRTDCGTDVYRGKPGYEPATCKRCAAEREPTDA